MSDRISTLRHSTAVLAKTWLADGKTSDYADGKYFTLKVHEIASLADFLPLLEKLEQQPKVCVIRGRYVGDEIARARDLPDLDRKPPHEGFKNGQVRKALIYFDDQPLHLVCLDIDGFHPVSCGPIEDPVGAIEEFVCSQLPDPFVTAGYVWQLSNSFGHPEKIKDGLKVHLWFWLSLPLTSAQFKAYAVETGLKADLALFQPVQPHYTAAPILEAGVECPVGQRHGYVPGVCGDEVELVISEAARAAVLGSSSGTKLQEIASTDPIALRLAELGLIKSQIADGFNIVCPFADEHTGESGETSTQYRLPHTRGHADGHFMCRHAHCQGRTRSQFLARIGVDEDADDFADLTAAEGAEHDPAAPKPKGVPQAKHLTTDQANAGRLVRAFGKRLIVVAGVWYAWTGARWEQDDGEVYRFGCTLSKIIHKEADEWRAKKAHTDDERKQYAAIAEALAKWAQRSEMKASIEAALGLAKKLLGVHEKDINRNPWLLNCRNGTVDLRTGEMKDHDPMDYITKIVPFDYDPNARSETWERIIARVTLEEGMTTQPVASFLQRWFGYCATGSTREQAFVVHYGSGSNGKSTIIDTISTVLGDYAAAAAPGLLVAQSRNERHPTEVADLFGRRMVTAHETTEGGHLREDLVKRLTGGDKVKARYMGADFFEFDPTHKLQMLTNHKPQIKGQDGGIWRRVLLVPYLARFAEAEEVTAGRAHYVKDTRTAERLKHESQGVLTWLVEGARAWFTDGLRAPDIVLAASKDYQSEQDRIGQFVDECCELGLHHSATLSGGVMGSIYDEYKSWCVDNGMQPLSVRKFADELDRVIPYMKVSEGREGGSRKKIRIVQGVRLLETELGL